MTLGVLWQPGPDGSGASELRGSGYQGYWKEELPSSEVGLGAPGLSRIDF